MHKAATFFSYLLHPVIVPLLVCTLLLHYCPPAACVANAHTTSLWLMQIAFNTILYPCLVALLVWKLGFAKSLHMHSNQERLAPLMANILFSFWAFYAFHKGQSDSSAAMRGFLLTSFITTCALFITTIFTKISIHTTAWAAAFMASLQCYFSSTYHLPLWVPLFFCAALIIVALSRLALKAHTRAEIISALLIGCIAQAAVWQWYIK